MSTQENIAAVRRYLEGIDGGNLAVVDEVFSSDAVVQFPGSPELDRAGWKQLLAAIYGAFPDLHHQIEDQITSEDRMAFRWTAPGTHRQAFQGIEATGKQVMMQGTSIVHFSGGKVVEYTLTMDRLSLLEQLGALPQPAAAAR